MNVKECWETLELKPGASEEELKKQYKKLTKKYHPDINKDPGAEDKFKKISSSYEFLKNQTGSGQVLISPLVQRDIHTEITLSFKDSVLGCSKEIKYSRNVKCKKCQGQGAVPKNAFCNKCQGRGQSVTQKGNQIFIQQCDQCIGGRQVDTCTDCYGQRIQKTETKVSVTIPAGINNQDTLRLNGMGDFVASFFADYSDVFLKLNVEPDPDFTLEGTDVVHKLKLSLLEALEGCKKKVRTIFDEKEIVIPALSRHKDEVIIEKCGVNKLGSQRVILDVSYPDNLAQLLKENNGVLN